MGIIYRRLSFLQRNVGSLQPAKDPEHTSGQVFAFSKDPSIQEILTSEPEVSKTTASTIIKSYGLTGLPCQIPKTTLPSACSPMVEIVASGWVMIYAFYDL